MVSMNTFFKIKKIHAVFAVAIALAGAIFLDAAIYGKKGSDGNGQSLIQLGVSAIKQAGVNPFSTGTMGTFVIRKTPRDFPNVKFKDGSGKELSLEDWRGKVVLINLWATWCAPCRHEMPGLDRLQGGMGGDNFEVLAISIDRKGAKVAQDFLDEIKTQYLKLYIDKTAKISRESKAFGLPVSILINREGKEIGRLIGPAEWDSNHAKALITAAIRGKLLSAKAQ